MGSVTPIVGRLAIGKEAFGENILELEKILKEENIKFEKVSENIYNIEVDGTKIELTVAPLEETEEVEEEISGITSVEEADA